MVRWILLIYKIPPTPARHRIGVWRKLKKLGAAYLQKSVVVLPDNAYLRDELENLAHDIENFRGEATIVFTSSIEKEEKIITVFHGQVNKEYEKIIARGGKFLNIISFGQKRSKIKELDAILEELKQKLADARHMDYFDAEKRKEAEKAVQECEERYLRLLREA
jgi:hypothetical protein